LKGQAVSLQKGLVSAFVFGIDLDDTDWAYVEDFCRRLTTPFSDVYVFTIPLYLPKQDRDGKWRVVSTPLLARAGLCSLIAE
jgi:hypothetical protein